MRREKIKMIQTEPHRENILKKINKQRLTNCGTIIKEKTFVPVESQKEKGKRARHKTC